MRAVCPALRSRGMPGRENLIVKLVKVMMMGAALVLGTAVLAMPAMKTAFTDLYKPKAEGVIAKANCLLCHVSMTSLKKLDPYGAAMQTEMKKAKTKKLTADILKKIETLDSDKDGVKNIDEIKADTLPGDPKSK